MFSNNRNLRSSGCHACIRRKVKCDGGRPACLRCSRRKQECPGYRSWDELFLRNCSVVVVADDSWKQEALPCFLAFHTTSGTSSMQGYMDFISELVSSEFHFNETFRDAAMAAGAACLARHAKNRYPNLDIEATKLYGQALHSLRTALANEQSIGQDSTLAAIILLSTTGTIAGITPTAISPHHRAEIAVASLRSIRRIEDQTLSGRMLKFVRLTAATRSMFFPRISHPYNLHDDHVSAVPKDFRNVFFLSSHACTTLRAAIKTQSKDAPIAARRVLRLVEHMPAFSRLFPPHFGRIPIQHNGKLAYAFSNYAVASIWVSLWCAQIRLTEVLEAYLSKWPDRELSEGLDNIVRINNSISPVQRVLASVPFLLGEIDEKGNRIPADQTPANPGPMLLSIALFVVGDSSNAGITPEERAWVLDRLSYIGHERGIGHALFLREDLLSAHPGSNFVDICYSS